MAGKKRFAHSDNLTRGPEIDLRSASKRLCLREDREDKDREDKDREDKVRYRIAGCPFFAVPLPTGQILWECDECVWKEDVKELLFYVTEHKQSMHINTGTHGDERGNL
eukprot:494962-Hanusia_phi.AAC.3